MASPLFCEARNPASRSSPPAASFKARALWRTWSPGSERSWSEVGFSFRSLGIITGAIWADVAWGAYWSWDPKETWSLITWLVYAAFLHARLVQGWRGRRTAMLSVAGFVAMISTYLGVNHLLSGLHSYA